jgi:hypothetical protein
VSTPTDLPNPPPALPACCIPSANASLAERLYCVYNRAAPDGRQGLNYQGLPCPVWLELPEGIRHRWEAVANAAPDWSPVTHAVSSPCVDSTGKLIPYRGRE